MTLTTMRIQRALALVTLGITGAAGDLPGQPGTTASVSGAARQLVCRGKAGIDLRVYQDPSPRDISKKYVMMVLNYARPSTAPGSDYQNLQPGECTWNPLGAAGVPPEPGRVYFELLREAQPWSAHETRGMDTTIKAGVFFPDPVSLPRYLGDPSHYYGFFVDDASHYSWSFGAWRETAVPRYFTISGPIGPATSPDTRKELRCRGGASGLTFTRGGSAGTNLVNMTLAYRVSASEPGRTGAGLDPGSCAWVERAGMPREPGRVDFTTAGNAQLHQIRSGGTVDRTATAAERFPDANTIPVYLSDRNSYWTFTVTVGSPSTARAHGHWKMGILDVATARSPTSQPKVLGGREEVAKPRSADTSSVLSISRVGLTFREVVRKPVEVWLRFAARAGASPTVAFGSQPPVRDASTGQLGFPGSSSGLPVRLMETKGFAAEYSTAPARNLPRGTKYYFLITVPAGQNMPLQQYGGEFTTMTQSVVVHLKSIHMLNDSDKLSPGNVSLRLYLAPAPNDRADCRPYTDCEHLFHERSWETGKTYPLSTTLRMKSAPDRIRVWVHGWDWDASGNADPKLPGPGGHLYTAGGGSNGDADWNTAKGEFNVGALPDQTQLRIPFRLRSIDGAVFMFEVHGEIEVTRQ